MKSVFEASTGIEAHMIKNLLHLNDVVSDVFGEHLQGGIGDLQASGVVRVMVADEDYEQAQEIVHDWESSQPAYAGNTEEKTQSHGSYGAGLIGFILGAAVVFFFIQSSIELDGVDYDEDGKLDERWTYLNNKLRSTEVDQNRDGKVDLIYSYDLAGLIKSMELDSNFDGYFEYLCNFRLGNTTSCRSDSDDDGFYERREYYTHGVLASVSIFSSETQKIKKKQFFKGQRLTHSDVDLDGDGKRETRYEYDEFEQIKAR